MAVTQSKKGEESSSDEITSDSSAPFNEGITPRIQAPLFLVFCFC